MINGLKLTMRGEEIRTLLDDRIQVHQRRAAHWNREAARTHEEQTVEHPLLPTHMCENEAERHDWRVSVLTFIRDHLQGDETYQLGESDLAFGELLPEKPGWVEQGEYESDHAVGFGLERLAREMRSSSYHNPLMR